MNVLPELKEVKDLDFRKDPNLEAWVHHFLTENNIEYLQNPSYVSSPEQLEFIVALEEGQIYIPTSDKTFLNIYRGGSSQEITKEYLKGWKFIVTLIKNYNLDVKTRKRITNFCRLRFMSYLNSQIILPSRMIKRLVDIVLSQCADSDPFIAKKQAANAKALETWNNPKFKQELLYFPSCIQNDLNIHSIRWELDCIELSRLFLVSTMENLWTENQPLSTEQLSLDFATNNKCNECLRSVFGTEEEARKKILYIPDVAGAFIFDLFIIKNLLRLGHQVILSVKSGFYFNTPNILDLQTDPSISSLIDDAYFMNNSAVSKNELLLALREHRFVIINDGTKEQLNFYHASTTFARAWKECDLVIAKGQRNYNTLIKNSLNLTRKVLAFWRSDENNEFHISIKKRAGSAHKFTEKDIMAVADDIIYKMRKAQQEGKTIMFYSAVIGSIPGQTKTAIALVNIFVEHLRNKLENTFIINPAEHFIEGMDGDDLMFMWERVQRSGYLDVWRFQTTEDIEQSFNLMGKKTPSVWSGKDSTFSTGCTKEMRIAISVQKDHPELQIMGPAPERFFRRSNYGVGKYFDATLNRSEKNN